jgi:regulator of cell morphogenesis and NO signaling
MSTEALSIPVGRLATERPASVAVLEKHGIDYCCGGTKPFDAACAAKGLDPEALLSEIAAAESLRSSPEPTMASDSLAALVAHVVKRYHAKLREDLPRLETMTGRVVRAHGERHAALVAPLAETFGKLRAALEPHLVTEEDVLFPRVLHLELLWLGGRAMAPDEAVGHVVAALNDEHEEVGALLVTLREVTNGYSPIADACGTWRGLLTGLLELEGDIHRHVHLENNVLFPAVLRLLRPAQDPEG